MVVTTSAAWQKLFSPELRIGFLAHARDMADKLAAGVLPPARMAQAPQLIFNDRIDAVLTALFLLTTWVLVFETARVCRGVISGRRKAVSTETPYTRTQLAEA